MRGGGGGDDDASTEVGALCRRCNAPADAVGELASVRVSMSLLHPNLTRDPLLF
jgi:hypothetical protein